MRIKAKTFADHLARTSVQSSKNQFFRKTKNRNELFLKIIDNTPCIISYNLLEERFIIEFIENKYQLIYYYHGIRKDDQIIYFRNIIKRVPDLFVGGLEMLEILRDISPAGANNFHEHLEKSQIELLGMENHVFIQELKSFDKELLNQFKERTVELYFHQIQKMVSQIIEKLINRSSEYPHL